MFVRDASPIAFGSLNEFQAARWNLFLGGHMDNFPEKAPKFSKLPVQARLTQVGNTSRVDVNTILRIERYKTAIISAMMQCAERDTIRSKVGAIGFGDWKDMCTFKQLELNAAHRAPISVRG